MREEVVVWDFKFDTGHLSILEELNQSLLHIQYNPITYIIELEKRREYELNILILSFTIENNESDIWALLRDVVPWFYGWINIRECFPATIVNRSEIDSEMIREKVREREGESMQTTIELRLPEILISMAEV